MQLNIIDSKTNSLYAIADSHIILGKPGFVFKNLWSHAPFLGMVFFLLIVQGN